MKQPDFVGTPTDTLQFFVDNILDVLSNKSSTEAGLKGFLAGTAGELGNVSAIIIDVLQANAAQLEGNKPAHLVLNQIAVRLRERSEAWNSLVVSLKNETVTPS